MDRIERQEVYRDAADAHLAQLLRNLQVCAGVAGIVRAADDYHRLLALWDFGEDLFAAGGELRLEFGQVSLGGGDGARYLGFRAAQFAADCLDGRDEAGIVSHAGKRGRSHHAASQLAPYCPQ